MDTAASKMIMFLHIDMDSARVLCAEMIDTLHLIWEDKGSYALLQGKQAHIDAFELWVKGFFKQGVILGECLESIALERLTAQNLTLATAESCTGGLLSYRFTRIAGASSVFVGGITSYANVIKERILGVAHDDLRDFGAVSEPVVGQMLRGVLKQCGADIAIASSGVAGPSGGSAQKPVGSVFLGVQAAGKPPIIEQHFFATNNLNLVSKHHPIDYTQTTISYHLTAREYIQLEASTKALEMLIKYLNTM